MIGRLVGSVGLVDLWIRRQRGFDICSCQLVCCDAQSGENDEVSFLRRYIDLIAKQSVCYQSEKKGLLAMITY
jgi:hypothetical protein